MRHILRSFVLAILVLSSIFVPLLSCAAPAEKLPAADRLPDEVGPHHRSWIVRQKEHTKPERGNKDKDKLPRREVEGSRVVEIATGMNYWDGKEYVSSDPRFELTAESFVARRIQHPVTISANINQAGAVKLVTPDGKKLNSTPVAIGLYDALSGKSLIIGTIADSAGVLVAENRIVFENAFTGVCADIVYTVEQGSFEQDIVFTGKINPADYDFPEKTTRIQIYTEFYNAPQPDRQRLSLYVEKDESIRKKMASPDRMDEIIRFGELVIGTGKAFSLSANQKAKSASVIVAKETRVIEGRTFLVESVEYRSIQKWFETLPECGVAQASAPKKKTINQAGIPMPATAENAVKSSPRRAARELARLTGGSGGVVIDYRAHIGGNGNTPTVFRGDYTYLVTGDVYCYSPVTIEGGAVFKYKAGKGIYVWETFTSKASAYRPAVFTAMDDNTIGESAAGYTSATTGYTGQIASTGYANPALGIAYANSSDAVDHFRFRYAQTGVSYIGGEENPYLTIRNSQFLECVRGIHIESCAMGSAATISVQNSLVASVQYPFYQQISAMDYYSTIVKMENCTIDNSVRLITKAGAGILEATALNTIFSRVQYLDDVVPDHYVGGLNNGFYASFNGQTFGGNPVTSQSNPFQNRGAGHFYLANSSFRDCGTTLIDSALRARLKKTTTYPPQIRNNVMLWTDEEWGRVFNEILMLRTWVIITILWTIFVLR